MSSSPPPALAVNHVGVTVPDIHAAIDWYGEVFGFRCIMGPRVLEAAGRTEAASVFGSRFRRAWQAHLLSANSVGIELFRFIDPPTGGRRAEEGEPWFDRGLWHRCITHPDVAAMVDRIEDHGVRYWRRPTNSCPARRGRWLTPPTRGARSSR